jgi:hypothetical protein
MVRCPHRSAGAGGGRCQECQRGAGLVLASADPEQIRKSPFLLIGRHGRRDCGDPPHAVGRTRHLLRRGLRAGHGGVRPGRSSPDRWLTAVPLSLRTEEGRVPGAFWTWRGGGWGVATRGAKRGFPRWARQTSALQVFPLSRRRQQRGLGGEGRSGSGCDGS